MKVIRLKGEQYTGFMHNPEVRAELKKSYFDQHGSVLFMKPNGRILAVVRTDPGEPERAEGVDVEHAASLGPVEQTDEATIAAQQRSIKRQKNGGQLKGVPSPKGCKCITWPWPAKEERPTDERGKPTSHHPKCAFKGMWERQKGTRVAVVHHGPTLAPRIQRATEPKQQSLATPSLVGRSAVQTHKLKDKPLDKIPQPDVCPKCKDFTKSKRMEQDQHHPTCVYYKKYKAITVARVSIGKPAHVETHRFLIFDIEEQSAKREAEAPEVEEARRRLRDEGNAFVEVDGKDYLVLRSDGEPIEPADGEPQHVRTARLVEAPGEEIPENVNEADDPDLQGISPDEEEAERLESLRSSAQQEIIERTFQE